jgi:hypothetical protein
MTNKEWLATIPDEQVYEVMHWLFFEYGLMDINTRLAIIDWLGKGHEEGRKHADVV